MKVRIIGEIAILQPTGALTRDNGALELTNRIRDLIELGQHKILLNLDNIRYTDSPGIEALLSAYDAVAEAGGRLKFFNLSNSMQHILSMTKLSTEFDIFPDEGKAMSSFS